MREQMAGQPRKVFIGMSGGVDSSVAAALLVQQGYEVAGAFMKNWHGEGCTWEKDLADARRVAKRLAIPLYVFDFEEQYRKRVIDRFVDGYRQGITPNPDILCNKEIKFNLFLEHALALGFDFIATGHYARKRKAQSAKRKNGDTEYTLLAAKDEQKDQAYFLYNLTQGQLRHVLFPIGDYTKQEIRELAKKLGLHNWNKKDSYGICFIGEVDIRDFLKEWIEEKEGEITTIAGDVIGRHEGAAFYTIGQRRAVGIGGTGPYYVMQKNIITNTVVVTNKPEQLLRRELTAASIHWIRPNVVRFPLLCKARMRHQQPLQPCRVSLKFMDDTQTYAEIPRQSAFDSASVRVEFEEPQRAITPGQSIVFYQSGECLGGGIIDS
jgi:tRNA-specific 2-thiouridylase